MQYYPDFVLAQNESKFALLKVKALFTYLTPSLVYGDRHSLGSPFTATRSGLLSRASPNFHWQPFALSIRYQGTEQAPAAAHQFALDKRLGACHGAVHLR